MLWCRNNCEILLAKSPHIKFIVLIYPERGACTAKLFVGVVGNDVIRVVLHITIVNNYFKLHLS